MKKDEWKPDYGTTEFIPSWGATISGARKFLIAYNINVLGTKEQAHRVALNLRENGRGADKVCLRSGLYSKLQHTCEVQGGQLSKFRQGCSSFFSGFANF